MIDVYLSQNIDLYSQSQKNHQTLSDLLVEVQQVYHRLSILSCKYFIPLIMIYVVIENPYLKEFTKGFSERVLLFRSDTLHIQKSLK